MDNYVLFHIQLKCCSLQCTWVPLVPSRTPLKRPDVQFSVLVRNKTKNFKLPRGKSILNYFCYQWKENEPLGASCYPNPRILINHIWLFHTIMIVIEKQTAHCKIMMNEHFFFLQKLWEISFHLKDKRTKNARSSFCKHLILKHTTL